MERVSFEGTSLWYGLRDASPANAERVLPVAPPGDEAGYVETCGARTPLTREFYEP